MPDLAEEDVVRADEQLAPAKAQGRNAVAAAARLEEDERSVLRRETLDHLERFYLSSDRQLHPRALHEEPEDGPDQLSLEASGPCAPAEGHWRPGRWTATMDLVLRSVRRTGRAEVAHSHGPRCRHAS